MADTAINPESDLFALLIKARDRKATKRSRGEHQNWLHEQFVDGVFTPSVQRIPSILTGERSENALQQMFNRACEKLEVSKLDVLEVADGEFVIIDWNAEDVKEALSAEVLT